MLIQASKDHEDEFHLKLSSLDKQYAHDNCYKKYNLPQNIAQALNTDISNKRRDSPVSTLRSASRPYNYQTHCLICVKELNLGAAQRHPECCSQISRVEIISKDKKVLFKKVYEIYVKSELIRWQ